VIPQPGVHVSGCELRWADSGDDRGRGVFATRSYESGDVVETAPVIVIPAHHREHLDETVLCAYYFPWAGRGAIALGLISLYNHSFTPNVDMVKDLETETISAVVVAPVSPGDELTFNYGGTPDARTPVLFPEIP
jgi:SET domain-containing protein